MAILADCQVDVRWEDGYGNTYKNPIAPLKCLKECIGTDKTSYYEEIGLLNLTQEVLDRELEAIEERLASQHDPVLVKKYFKIVKQALRIDPHERKSVRSLLTELDK